MRNAMAELFALVADVLKTVRHWVSAAEVLSNEVEVEARWFAEENEFARSQSRAKRTP